MCLCLCHNYIFESICTVCVCVCPAVNHPRCPVYSSVKCLLFCGDVVWFKDVGLFSEFWAERIVKGFSASLSFYAVNSNENKDKTETKVKPKNKSVQDTV